MKDRFGAGSVQRLLCGDELARGSVMTRPGAVDLDGIGADEKPTFGPIGSAVLSLPGRVLDWPSSRVADSECRARSQRH